jgi:hypothetical protein
MGTAISDVGAVVKKWSPGERKLAVAAILRELESAGEAKPLMIKDETDATVGILMPVRSRARPFDMSQSTPYVDEIKRRLATADQSIPIDEVNEMLDRRAAQ